MTSLVELYQQELLLLKESAKVFSEEYPALTESLTRDRSDPDVEMILQGVSYLTAQFKRDINDQFPVALQALSQTLTPSLTQPIPSISILSMVPKANLLAPLKVKQGKAYNSSPIENNSNNPVTCRFSNAWDIDVLPLIISTVTVSHDQREIKDTLQRLLILNIQFDSSKNNISNYSFDKLRLFINQPNNDAIMWMLMLAKQLVSIEIKDQVGVHKLSRKAVSQTAFNPDKSILKDDGNSSLHQLLQEYFIVPEKFQFIDLDLSTWQQRNGNTFEINFIFTAPNFSLPDINEQHIKLFCSPIVNLFDYFTEPTAMNGVQLDFPLWAKQRDGTSEQILPIVDVVSVESVKKGRERNRLYQNLVKPQNSDEKLAAYHFYRKNGKQDGTIENCLALKFDPAERPAEQEVLRVKVECCNGNLASKIPPGNIIHPTSSSPELVKFTNLTTSTDYHSGVVVSHAAWQVISDQALSLQNINSAKQLKEVLTHHIPTQLQGSAKQKTYLHRIASIADVEVTAKDIFDNGQLKRGVLYHVTFDSSHFINDGESFLFASLMDQMFTLQIPLNSFSQLVVSDSYTGNNVTWPMRLGSML